MSVQTTIIRENGGFFFFACTRSQANELNPWQGRLRRRLPPAFLLPHLPPPPPPRSPPPSPLTPPLTSLHRLWILCLYRLARSINNSINNNLLSPFRPSSTTTGRSLSLSSSHHLGLSPSRTADRQFLGRRYQWFSSALPWPHPTSRGFSPSRHLVLASSRTTSRGCRQSLWPLHGPSGFSIAPLLGPSDLFSVPLASPRLLWPLRPLLNLFGLSTAPLAYPSPPLGPSSLSTAPLASSRPLLGPSGLSTTPLASSRPL